MLNVLFFLSQKLNSSHSLSFSLSLSYAPDLTVCLYGNLSILSILSIYLSIHPSIYSSLTLQQLTRPSVCNVDDTLSHVSLSKRPVQHLSNVEHVLPPTLPAQSYAVLRFHHGQLFSAHAIPAIVVKVPSLVECVLGVCVCVCVCVCVLLYMSCLYLL